MSTPHPPIQNLLFFVADEINDHLRLEVANFVGNLADKRNCTVSAPIFVNEIDIESVTQDGDVPIETLGGYLKIYSAWTANKPSKGVDIKTYEDVRHMVDALCEFSKLKSISFEFELDGTHVGEIRAGNLDRNLSVGLLKEWERQLG